MYFLGSLFETPSNGSYTQGLYHIQTWSIEEPSSYGTGVEKIEITRKTFLPFKERVLAFIDAFEEIFPKPILDDAKRIAFDIKINSQTPHTIAINSLYLASDLHNHQIDQTQFMNFLKNSFSDMPFVKLLNTGTKFFRAIKENKEIIKKELGEEKFKRLKNVSEAMSQLSISGSR